MDSVASLDAAEDEDRVPRQIYVRAASKGRAWQPSCADIKAFFAACGKPRAVYNKWGEELGDEDSVREVAILTFRKNKCCAKAIGLTGTQLAGREVVVGLNTRPFQKRVQPKTSIRVFVGNLPFDADDASIKEMFAACGRVLFVRFATDADGKHRGFCHLIFEDPDGTGGAAYKALQLDGADLKGRPVKVAPAIEHEKQKRPPKRQQAAPEPEARPARKAHKELRPPEWRHDRAAGLTLPRKHAAATHDKTDWITRAKGGASLLKQ